MEGSIYENIIEKFCSDNFYFEDVCIEKPDGLLNTRKYDYDLILFNSKKIIFFARLDETLSKKEIVYKLRESLNFLVTKFALGLNSFIVFGANNEQYFFLNKYNDVLKVFERDSDTIIQMCDNHNIPIATNLATAELLIKALERGDLDWRDLYR